MERDGVAPESLPFSNVSTHTLRVERDLAQVLQRAERAVSTHTLRVERDTRASVEICKVQVSTHTLRVERDKT